MAHNVEHSILSLALAPSFANVDLILILEQLVVE